MMRLITAYVEYDPETQLYVGMVPDIPGAHSTGETLDELRLNLQEVLELCREEGVIPEDMPQFVGPMQNELDNL